MLFGTPVTIAAVRPGPPSRAPTTYNFAPTHYPLQYSSTADPVLRLVPGDRVRTTTLDNEGVDATLRWRGMPGNTLTGPFYVEGAMPGDTLVVHLNQIRLNRDSARMFSGSIDQRAVEGGYVQAPADSWDRTWTLDREHGVARLALSLIHI